MALKYYKPVTSSMRQLITVDTSHLWKGSPVKDLVEGMVKSGGRNNLGRITSWRTGGGHKRLYRIIDFKRSLHNINGTVLRLEYDPNRTSFIALIGYDNGILSYILAPSTLNVGDSIVSGTNVPIKVGNALPLKDIPVGTLVHNIELKPGNGGQLARSAGSSARIVTKLSDGNGVIRLKSGEYRIVNLKCMATIGVVSNLSHKNISISKAGRSRWLGIRPTVRGVAMNPIDHPHGGGEGKSSGGRPSVTPWGKSTKGKKTRSSKRTNRFILRKRS